MMNNQKDTAFMHGLAKMMHSNFGFTLIEVLIALAVLGFVSVMAFDGLNSSMTAQEKLQNRMQDASDLQLTMTLLLQDISNLVRRPVQPFYDDDRLPAFDDEPPGESTLSESYNCSLALSRIAATSTPGLVGAPLFRVAYCLNNAGQLTRLLWPFLDPGQGSVPYESVLMRNVEFFEVEAQWPAIRGQYRQGSEAWLEIVPDSLEISIELEQGTVYSRTFRMLDNSYPVLLKKKPPQT